MSKGIITKSDIARELGVSRAYVTMIANGKRKPSPDIVNKMESLGFTTKQTVNKSNTNSLTLNQQVPSSSLGRLTFLTCDSYPTSPSPAV